MEVESFEMEPFELAPDDRRAQIYLAFRDGFVTSWVLTERQTQAIAMTMVDEVRNGTVPGFNGMCLDGKLERSNEFQIGRVRVKDAQRLPRGLLIVEVRASLANRQVVVEVVSHEGAKESAVFDGFAAEAFVISADDCFG